MLKNYFKKALRNLIRHKNIYRNTYRININWWMFALAAGISLMIALPAISNRAIKAATANPVESLRCE